MTKFARLASSNLWSAVLLVAVIGSLCFSVGEGLRLTPFPVSAAAQIEETNNLAPAGEARGSVLAQYGPLSAPSPLQKRSKRQTADFAFPPEATGSQLVVFTWHYSGDESIPLRSSLFMTRPAGRAPPFVS